MKHLRLFLPGTLLTLSLVTSLAFAFDLDVDNDSKTTALTDGLLVIRYLFGFEGDSLTTGAVGEGASRPSASDIADHIRDNESFLDVDQDGEVAPLTDGLLIIRLRLEERRVLSLALRRHVSNLRVRGFDLVCGAGDVLVELGLVSLEPKVWSRALE